MSKVRQDMSISCLLDGHISVLKQNALFTHGGKGGFIGLDGMNYWLLTWQGTGKCSGRQIESICGATIRDIEMIIAYTKMGS